MYLLIIFVLASFIGYFVIWGVTSSLHSPLMSVSNAISGIIIIGAMLSFDLAENQYSHLLSLLAVFFSSINIFGGFALSERMLEMFRHKKDKGGNK